MAACLVRRLGIGFGSMEVRYDKGATLSFLRQFGMGKLLDLMGRITQTPGLCGGRPCIRGMRIRVCDVLEMLAENVTAAEIR
jgi:Protein of unknown function (DUF433)